MVSNRGHVALNGGNHTSQINLSFSTPRTMNLDRLQRVSEKLGKKLHALKSHQPVTLKKQHSCRRILWQHEFSLQLNKARQNPYA